MKTLYNKKYFEQRDFLSPHLADLIKNLIKNYHLEKALDVGCSTGRLVHFLNQTNLVAYGCDISDEAIRVARKINKAKSIIKASATDLPFKNKTFDLVTALSVIEHLTPYQAQKFLSEASRVLKPGGVIFLVSPNFSTPIRLIQGKKWFGYTDPTHINFYTPTQLSVLVKKYGFNNIRFQFKLNYHQSFDWEFPSLFSKLPKTIKKILIYLLFSSPLHIIRNSFWIAAQKD